MLEKPDAADLLATAREVVLKELLPALPEHQKLAARMVAAAMALAIREAAVADGAVDELRRRAAGLLGAPEDVALQEFAAAIRSGRFDPGRAEHGAALSLLRDMARLRAEVSAPKVLGG